MPGFSSGQLVAEVDLYRQAPIESTEGPIGGDEKNIAVHQTETNVV
jgi:hypothetical protein